MMTSVKKNFILKDFVLTSLSGLWFVTEMRLNLPYTEFEILLLLAQNAGIVFSKEQIYDSVWKEPYFGDYNIVMSHIRNIREKIEDTPRKPVYIQTVWGVGYRFNQTLQIREML